MGHIKCSWGSWDWCNLMWLTLVDCIALSLTEKEKVKGLMEHWSLLKIFYPEKQSRGQEHRSNWITSWKQWPLSTPWLDIQNTSKCEYTYLCESALSHVRQKSVQKVWCHNALFLNPILKEKRSCWCVYKELMGMESQCFILMIYFCFELSVLTFRCCYQPYMNKI